MYEKRTLGFNELKIYEMFSLARNEEEKKV